MVNRTELTIVGILLTVHTGLLAWSACVHSPNANEPSHIAAGICHWQLQRFDLYRVNPPLIRLIAALPVLAAGTKTDWSNLDDSPRHRSEFRVGPDWVAANGERSLWLITLARWSCIPFSLVGGIVCFFWARELYGSMAGLTACVLWCFSPNILGHASCITPDAHATAVGVAANYLFWKWLRKPSWVLAGIVGLLLGLALLTKTTWISLIFLWPILSCCWLLRSRSRIDCQVAMRAMQLSLALLLGIHVLNLGFLYGGTFNRLGDFIFISRTLSGKNDGIAGNRFRGTLLGAVPVPLPSEYVLGIDVQKQDHERHPVMYFRGATRDCGIWYFYLYAMGVKVPLGIWLLAVAAVAATFSHRGPASKFRDERVMLAPFFVILLLASSETDYTTHFRYVLPIVPYAFIWISQVGRFLARLSYWTPIVVFGLLWSVGSSLSCTPHWLSYFNEFAGGPANGYRHLANSNLDWGQDLLYLRRWIANHPDVDSIGLAYYGMFNPRDIGMKFTDVPGWIDDSETSDGSLQGIDRDDLGPRPGWYAVSINFVVGHPFWNYRADGSRGWFGRTHFLWFESLEPVSRVGYSIFVYDVRNEDIDRLRSQLADVPLSDLTQER